MAQLKSAQFYSGNLVNHRSNRRKLPITFPLQSASVRSRFHCFIPLLKLVEPLGTYTPCMFWFVTNLIIICFVIFRWQLEPCKWHPSRQSTHLSRFIVKTLTWALVRHLFIITLYQQYINYSIITSLGGWQSLPVTIAAVPVAPSCFGGRPQRATTTTNRQTRGDEVWRARRNNNCHNFFTTLNSNIFIICVTFAIKSRTIGWFVPQFYYLKNKYLST